MKLQIVAAILLVTILSPKRSSAEQVGALDHETPFEEAVGEFMNQAPRFVGDLKTLLEEAVGMFPKHPAGKGFPLEFMNRGPRFVGHRVNGAMICGLRIRNY
ncbi:unnamed protein product [Natator depressus]